MISIVMPFRNEARYLDAALRSIQAQSLTDFELIAIDDGSSDDSAELVHRAAAQDTRIRCVRNVGGGLVDALNLGLSLARAPLIARMDADDIMCPERLRLQYAAIRKDPRLTVVGCRVRLFPAPIITEGASRYIDWLNGCMTHRDIARNRFVESPLAHPSVLFRKARIQALGGYRDGDFPEDYELWLRLLDQGARFGKCDANLLDWRERPERASRTDPRYARPAFDRLRAEYLLRWLGQHLGKRPIVFWGAGRKTRLRQQPIQSQGVAPIAYIDIDPRKIGNRIADVPVAPPDWLRRAKPKPFVLVYVANHGARERIAEALEGMGYRIEADWLAVG